MDENNTEGITTVVMTEEKEPQAPSQKQERSEKEKAEFSLRKTAERLRELGGNPVDVLDIHPEINLDEDLPDDKPLTVKDFRNLQKRDAHQTALQMVDELPEDERDEVRNLLQNRIVPSGNAQEDIRLARAAVNAARNSKIIEHISGRSEPKRTAAGGSSDAQRQGDMTLTPEEEVFTRPPYNLTIEKIISKRVRKEA